ncbi:hypothetical protein QLX08_009513 [Tetragonisca angustula]|uniref:Uncharacterized protein n=1 Tax=Tetragonisca angustula TaxID=166442 RepID=A0AAW0ZG79_9HYME
MENHSHVDVLDDLFSTKRNTPDVGREALNRLPGNRRQIRLWPRLARDRDGSGQRTGQIRNPDYGGSA